MEKYPSPSLSVCPYPRESQEYRNNVPGACDWAQGQPFPRPTTVFPSSAADSSFARQCSTNACGPRGGSGEFPQDSGAYCCRSDCEFRRSITETPGPGPQSPAVRSRFSAKAPVLAICPCCRRASLRLCPGISGTGTRCGNDIYADMRGPTRVRCTVLGNSLSGRAREASGVSWENLPATVDRDPSLLRKTPRAQPLILAVAAARVVAFARTPIRDQRLQRRCRGQAHAREELQNRLPLTPLPLPRCIRAPSARTAGRAVPAPKPAAEPAGTATLSRIPSGSPQRTCA